MDTKIMRYDPTDRILSLSFTRDPSEHADVMIEAGRRTMTHADRIKPGTALLLAIGFGTMVGIATEIYRRFVLPLLLGSSEIAPLSTVALQLLPTILLIIALYAALDARAKRRRRQALISRLQADQVIDVEIFQKGVSTSDACASIKLDWSGVRDIVADSSRVELECESYVIYVPARAFATERAYASAVRDMRRLWRDAVKQDRDRKMIAAGLE